MTQNLMSQKTNLLFMNLIKRLFKAKVGLGERNFEYVLKDKNGNIKPLFQPNLLCLFLIKQGLLSANSETIKNIPFLFGSWQNKMVIANLITSAGKAGVASRINGSGAAAPFTYIAIGTGAVAASIADTILGGEITTLGGQRAAATPSLTTTTVANDTARNVVTFTFTGSFAITESGCLNAASAGSLLNRQVFTAVNVVTSDFLQITIDVSVG
jgi:hypothetical protein